MSEIFPNWESMVASERMVALKSVEWCIKNRNKLFDGFSGIQDELVSKFDEVLGEFYHTTFKRVMKENRQRQNVDFRNMVMHIYWKESRQSLYATAKVCGKCHSTLIHSFRDLDYQVAHSKNYQREYDTLKYRLMAKIHEQ